MTAGDVHDDRLDLLENMPCAFHSLGPDAVIRRVNATWLRWLGYTREEVEGKLPFTAVLTEASQATFAERFPGLQRDGRLDDVELMMRRKDSSTFLAQVSASAVHDAHGRSAWSRFGFIDISGRKIASDRLADAVASIDDAFGIFDAAGALVMHNNAFRSLYDGLVEGELVGRRAEELALAVVEGTGVDPGQRAGFVAERLAILSEPGVIPELERRGRLYRVVTRRTREGGAVVVLFDRSEERQREEALRRASAAKTEFLASMSHELRTPLNAVLGFSQLLRRDRKTPLTPRQDAMMAQIVSAGEHLLRLVDEVLDLARIEAGRVPISIEPIEVAEVVRQAVATLEPMAARAGVELVVAPSVTTGGRVMADRTRLAQVLMSFGSNAIKYGRRGGRATISASHPAAGRVRLSVIDDGIGIPVDEQEHVFRPFHRAGQETGPIEGTGVGLAITRNLVEMMGGSVGFLSRPGAGSEFWAELAAAEAGAAQAAPASLHADSSLAGGAPSRTLVYVEDHPANIAFMHHLLSEMASVTLLTAPTAEIGVELVRARRADAVILDINLPGMSGFEALRLLQTWPETRDIPVIALSAAALEHDIRRGQEAGFFRYLTKPVKVDELLSALELALGSASAAR